MGLSLVVDGFLAVLLLVTLIYVARLHRRLGQLRDSRQEFETLIARFTQATELADRSLADIKAAAAVEGQELQATIDRGRGLREDLTFMTDKANGLADQLEAAIARARNGLQRPTVTPPKDRLGKEQPKESLNDKPVGDAPRRFAQRPTGTADGGAMSGEERDLLKALASIR